MGAGLRVRVPTTEVDCTNRWSFLVSLLVSDKSGAAAMLNLPMQAKPNTAAINVTKGVALATELETATSFAARSKGLLGAGGRRTGAC